MIYVFLCRYLRMGSDRTMAIAEAMYQRGIISYPRTETDYFAEGSFELRPLLGLPYTTHTNLHTYTHCVDLVNSLRGTDRTYFVGGPCNGPAAEGGAVPLAEERRPR